MNSNNGTTNGTTSNVRRETISELAHRHILDPNHTTTDDELRNALIEFNVSFDYSIEGLSQLAAVDNETVIPPLPFEKENNTEGSQSNADVNSGSIPNPYSILK